MDFFFTLSSRQDKVAKKQQEKMARNKTLDAALDLVKKNPHTGSKENIVTLSIHIALSKETMDKSIYGFFKEKSNISPKIFSNLKKIGDTLLKIPEKKRNEVIEGLPAFYRTIYALCGLTNDELITAVKSKCVTASMSYPEAIRYIKQVKHPHLLATDGDKGRWSTKQEHLWSIFRTDDVYLEGKAFQEVEDAFRRVCREYGLVLRNAKETSSKVLREEERRERAAFWRRILEGEISQKWFGEQDDKLKKQFNLRNVDELRDTPIRQFTGFIIHASGGRENFWKLHSKAYIAKVYFLLETAEDAANRYNLKRRIEDVLGKYKELAIWRNLVLKNSGFM